MSSERFYTQLPVHTITVSFKEKTFNRNEVTSSARDIDEYNPDPVRVLLAAEIESELRAIPDVVADGIKLNKYQNVNKKRTLIVLGS